MTDKEIEVLDGIILRVEEDLSGFCNELAKHDYMAFDPPESLNRIHNEIKNALGLHETLLKVKEVFMDRKRSEQTLRNISRPPNRGGITRKGI